MSRPTFHLAIEVHDLARARAFYGDLLGCREGRSSRDWVDFDFHGHQLVCHLGAGYDDECTNPVDGHVIPIPHFGVVLAMGEWKLLAERLRAQEVDFVVEPHTRFEGQAGEQATLFIRDPSGNALEFKAFGDVERQLFNT